MKHKFLVLSFLVLLLAIATPALADAPAPSPTPTSIRFNFEVENASGGPRYSFYLEFPQELWDKIREAVKNMGLLLGLLTPETPTTEITPTPTATPIDDTCYPTAETTPTATSTTPETLTPTPTATLVVTVNSIEYGTEFPSKITFTNGEVITRHTAPYTNDELSTISSTWISYAVEMPKNTCFAVAFGYSVRINGKTYSPGALIMLPTDQEVVTVEILDGELVIWRSLSAMHDDVEYRISTEIENGNLSIKGPLAFLYLSQEFSGYIPRDLIDSRGVTIVR